ncbi:hypothetical protein AVEN_6824-1 [Araneus ventricosus]|uniref:Uncharacterized protein n=1 Tax=Araneus ventricosus TaxID=182803 RepID=A0A4Y2K1M8_ARAVE|nr:hypothetical protein AVEN_6824-1 [Araneus ventricosus]
MAAISRISSTRYNSLRNDVSGVHFQAGMFSGGLFDTEDDEQELAFRIAVDKINADTSVLPRSRLVAQVEKVGVDDSFRATKKGTV